MSDLLSNLLSALSKPKGTKPSRGAPAPIAGVGLPVIALAGVYWLCRRRNRLAAEAEGKAHEKV